MLILYNLVIFYKSHLPSTSFLALSLSSLLPCICGFPDEKNPLTEKKKFTSLSLLFYHQIYCCREHLWLSAMNCWRSRRKNGRRKWLSGVKKRRRTFWLELVAWMTLSNNFNILESKTLRNTTWSRYVWRQTCR